MRVSVVGGAGYVAGELVRILVGHPQLNLGQVASRSRAGRWLSATHPNLRGFADQLFVNPEELEPCDALLVAGDNQGGALEELRDLAPVIVDCGPSLRLKDPSLFEAWYGSPPRAEAMVREVVYGLPEINRGLLAGARLASGAGCSAVATILALLPVARAGWRLDGPACVEARFGSSAAGARPGFSSHHPERAGAVRMFAPEGHRHQAEVAESLGWDQSWLSYSGVALGMVRGISVSVRCFLQDPVTEREVWDVLRSTHEAEPFVRVVAQKSGLHRFPDPRWLAGTNLCDVGFYLDKSGRRLVLMAALDNLGKGGAGNAIQTLNLMLGLDERSGLTFPGLHPL